MKVYNYITQHVLLWFSFCRKKQCSILQSNDQKKFHKINVSKLHTMQESDHHNLKKTLFWGWSQSQKWWCLETPWTRNVTDTQDESLMRKKMHLGLILCFISLWVPILGQIVCSQDLKKKLAIIDIGTNWYKSVIFS